MREIPASPSAVFRGVSYLLHPGHEYELGPESQRDRGPVDFEYAGALGNGKFAAVGLATALPSVIIPCTTHRRLYSFSESALLLSLRSPYISVFHDDVPLVVSTCVSPAVVLPGAKVALEQPSSSTSFTISLESSTCRSSYLLFNDCCLCPTLVTEYLTKKIIWPCYAKITHYIVRIKIVLHSIISYDFDYNCM